MAWGWASRIGLALTLAVPLISQSSQALGQTASAEQTAAIGPTLRAGTLTDSALPRVLSAADEARYRRIFAIQEDGKWRAADKLIGELDDPILLGHVQAQRYLHPTDYRTPYRELKAWMAAYPDHPQAKTIYKLALRRGPDAPVPRPELERLRVGGTGDGLRWEYSTWKRYRGTARSQRYKFVRAIRRGHTLVSKRILWSKQAKRLFHPVDYDRMAGAQGFKYFLDGRDDWALEWAGTAADRSGAKAPMALWGGGLAAWRSGDLKRAARYFDLLATSEHASSWMNSAGAYWAARAYLRDRRPEKVAAMLEIAAGFPRTFYGLLAHQALGTEPAFHWSDTAEAERAAFEPLLASTAGRRALALIQVGRADDGEMELRNLYPKADRDLAEAILHAAEVGRLPYLSLKLAHAEGDDSPWPRDGASYPVPDWQPDGGWRLDKALVYAFVRQESAFNPKAKSYRGARGLMQLMPATASFIGRDRGYRRSKRAELYEPGLNLMLGQRYLEHLLHNDQVNGNLLMLATAYNGGPGNLNRWLRSMRFQGDPLLFIEALPSRETRIFIERVLSNFWIYRKRMDQPTPSLALLVSGRWPLYTHLDDFSTEQVVRHARN